MKYLHPDDAARIEILKTKGDRKLTTAEHLIKRVTTFDHSYEYSDDIEVWRKWSALEKELKKDLMESDLINAEVKALALKAIKDVHGTETGPLTQLINRYPCIKYEHLQPTGFDKMLVEKGDEYVERAIETLRELDALIKELPDVLYPGYFIMTPATPHQKIMRDYARSEHGSDPFYGYALPKALHERVWNFFDKCMFQRDDWKAVINDYQLAKAKSAGIDCSMQYELSVTAPAKYTGTPAAWVSVHALGKTFSFYV